MKVIVLLLILVSQVCLADSTEYDLMPHPLESREVVFGKLKKHGIIAVNKKTEDTTRFFTYTKFVKNRSELIGALLTVMSFRGDTLWSLDWYVSNVRHSEFYSTVKKFEEKFGKHRSTKTKKSDTITWYIDGVRMRLIYEFKDRSVLWTEDVD